MAPDSWPLVRLLCGGCRRPLARPILTHSQGQHVWEDQVHWPAQGSGPWLALAAGAVVHMKKLPGATRTTGFVRDVDGPQTRSTTWSITCRCGRDYRLRSERLAEHWTRVKAGGVSADLVLGQDL